MRLSPRHAQAWWSVVRWSACMMLIAAVLSLLAHPWVHFSWWQTFRRCVSIASMLSLWWCVRRFERRSIQSYGLADFKSGKRQFVFGLCLGLATLGLLLLIGLASGVCRIGIFSDPSVFWLKLLGFLPAAVLIGVLEELIFRGFILQQLMRSSTFMAVLVSSVIYSLVHVRSSEWTLATFLQLVGLFLLACVLCFSYFRTCQLYLSIGLHASLAYGAGVNKLFLQFTAPFSASFAWLTGTSRLINGLASWAALLVMAAAIAWWTRRSDPPRRV